MTDKVQKFIDCLRDAEDLLKDYPKLDIAGLESTPEFETPSQFDLAEFEKWSEFIEPEFQQEPPVRIIQHLSCTGGTIMSKCIAGLPNVVLLSEVNPLSEMHVESNPPGFAPSDLIYLAKWAKIPRHEELAKEIFKAEIAVISKHARLLGKYLVIREHSHSDFLMGDKPRAFGTIREFLKDDHPIRAVVTVRHPVDSFLSLANMNSLHFVPDTFEEYCRRYSLFIDHNKNVPIYKYENFVEDPMTEIERISNSLDLPFNSDFMDIFDLNKLSGDSGRSSNIIEKRERRPFNAAFHNELIESPSYKALCNTLGYAASLDTEVLPAGG